MSEPPSMSVVLLALFFTVLVGYTVHTRTWAAAAGVFTYGLAIALGIIYQELKRR